MDIPELIKIHGEPCEHRHTFKADSVAVTCIYEGPAGPYIVKTSRAHPALLFLGGLAARYLTSREVAIGKRLQGVPGIPQNVVRLGPRTFAREYVAGKRLEKRRPVPDDFFDRLLELLAAMHERGVVHIDIEKPENILLGDDGKPYLIDFQISFCIEHLPALLRPLARPLFRRLVAADVYHLYKHKRRMRPDLTTPEEERMGRKTGRLLAIHRVLTKPYFFVRRKLVKVRGEEPPEKRAQTESK